MNQKQSNLDTILSTMILFKGNVVSFEYYSGSKPGTHRLIYITNTTANYIEGWNFEISCYRRFSKQYIKNLIEVPFLKLPTKPYNNLTRTCKILNKITLNKKCCIYPEENNLIVIVSN